MTKRISLLLAAAILAVPASAAAKPYKGRTKGGSTITFRLAGGNVSKLRTLVPTFCAETNGSYQTRAGGELFQPPGAFRLGRTGKAKALQPAAMNRGTKATKNYTVTTRAGRRGTVTGKLRVSFSFIGLNPWDVYRPYLWICTGTTTFTAR